MDERKHNSNKSLQAGPQKPMKTSPEAIAAVLLLSDTRIGFHVEYNVRQYCNRLFYVEQTAIRLLNQKVGGPDTDELHVFLLGNLLHGMIDHSAERESPELMADHLELVTLTLHESICRMASAVPRLSVHAIAGNYGRWPGQRKLPTVSRYPNFDEVLYGSLEHSLAAQDRQNNITFNFDRTPRQLVKIKNSMVHAGHVHLRGGDKQIAILLQSITKATSLRKAASNRPPVDYFLIGDQHKHVNLPLGSENFVINGSFCGFDEYSMANPPIEPFQLMFWVDPKQGKTLEYKIKPRFAPELRVAPYELPPNLLYLLEAAK